MKPHHLKQKTDSTNDSIGALIHEKLSEAFSNHSLAEGTYKNGKWEITLKQPESFYLFEVDLSSIIASAINNALRPSGNGDNYNVDNPFRSITYSQAWNNLEGVSWGEKLTSQNLDQLMETNGNRPLFIASPPKKYYNHWDPNPYEPKLFVQRLELMIPGLGVIGKGGRANGQYKFELDAAKLEQYVVQAY